MQTIRKNPFIIGLLLLFGLTIPAGNAHALYSPTIAKQVSIIRQHVTSSQAQHGDGSLLEAVENVKAYDKARRAAFDETGVYAEARVAQELIFDDIYDFLISNPFDSLFMVFNIESTTGTHISNCLRDDIWSLEKLRDMVGAEMVKAYLTRDTLHGRLLQEDYKYLSNHIILLRKYGWNPKAFINATNQYGTPVKITSHKYFFGDIPIGSGKEGDPALNYYSAVGALESSDATGCPDGEFEEAIEEVKNTWEVLKVMSTAQNVEWGNIWGMAKQNARIRARQWIQANQISLTLGGENGGRIQSLVKGGGWDKFVGNIKTELQVVKSMVGMVTPFFDMVRFAAVETAQGIGAVKECVFYDAESETFRNCSDKEINQFEECEDDEKMARAKGIRCDRFRNTDERMSIVEKTTAQQKLQKENEETLKETELAFTYYISMDSVAEQVIYEMDGILTDMNTQIKRGYEGVDKSAGEGIPTLLKELKAFADCQCQNQQ